MTANEGFRLIVALGLPWLAGMLFSLVLWRNRCNGRCFIALGYGFPIGMLATIGIMLGLDAMGYAQSFWMTCGMLVLLAFPPFLILQRGSPTLIRSLFQSRRIVRIAWAETTPAMQLLVTALLILIFIRLTGFFLEALWRPLFPWDAWYGYSVRTRIWFEHGALIPMVSAREWWAAMDTSYTSGGLRHPYGNSLLQLWIVLSIGRWDDALMNIPWAMAGLSTCLAIYGLARASGAKILVALAAAYCLISLPVFGTHAAIGGYGDIWVAMYLLIVAGSFFFGVRNHDWQQALFIVAGISGMLMMKESGLFWVPAFAIAVLFGSVKLPRAIVILGVALLTVLLIGWLLGVELRAGILGSYPLSLSAISLLEYHAIWADLARHLFSMSNWHLLWFIAPGIFIVGAFAASQDMAVRGLYFLTLSGVLMLLFIFLFTDAAQWVVKGTGVNRLILHITPALALLGVQVIVYLRDKSFLDQNPLAVPEDS